MENVMRIKWFEELDSTNSELLRHVGDYDNLSVVAAVNQTAGRGQRGNRWVHCLLKREQQRGASPPLL